MDAFQSLIIELESMGFVEWVQVITQIVTAITAVFMALKAYDTYLKAPEQDPESEPDQAVAKLKDVQLRKTLVFKTSKQETWLSATPHEGLFCEIKDQREGKGGPQWSLSPNQAKQILENSSFYVNSGYKVRTGTFSLGQRRNWLYSKALFPDPDYLHGVLKQLLQNSSS